MESFKKHVSDSEKKKWIRHQIHNTQRPHDEIKKEFLEKHGKEHEKMFDDVVHKEVD